MNTISPLAITTHLYAIEYQLNERRNQAEAHGLIHEARSRLPLFTWPALRRRQSEHGRQKSPRFSGAA